MNLIELERRVINCKFWEWMPGMNTSANSAVTSHGGIRITDVDYHNGIPLLSSGSYVTINSREGALPDLSDPATLGCLLHLVIEATASLGPRHVSLGGTISLISNKQIDVLSPSRLVEELEALGGVRADTGRHMPTQGD